MQHDIAEIKSDIKTLIIQGAAHNELLRQHEARSLALQKQQERIDLELDPIRTHVNLVEKLLKGLGLITIGGIVQLLARHFL
jgi:hypothetical protein